MLPDWHFVVLTLDQPIPSTIRRWTMGTKRVGFTALSSSASPTDRTKRLEELVQLLNGIRETQTCRSDSTIGSDTNHACASSRELSHRLSFILMNGESDQSTTINQEWTWNFHQLQKSQKSNNRPSSSSDYYLCHIFLTSYLVAFLRCLVYLSNFLTSLAPFVTFTVDSTVMHYGRLTAVDSIPTQLTSKQFQTITRLTNFQQQQIDAQSNSVSESTLHTAYQLPVTALNNFVGSVGTWNIQSPLVHSSMELIAYIPPIDRRPMFVDFSSSRVSTHRSVPSVSIYIPRYGGVAFINSPGECNMTHGSATCTIDEKRVGKEVMQIFVQQIRHTLALIQEVKECPSCLLLPASDRGITDWEIDLLGSRLISTNLAHSQRILNSLYDLLDQVPHMPVSSEIANILRASIEKSMAASGYLRARRWDEAGAASQAALNSAQDAFFHPNMLPALYFPDEHLYAVYLPLFLPITVPILAALIGWLTRKDEKARAAQQARLRLNQQEDKRQQQTVVESAEKLASANEADQ